MTQLNDEVISVYLDYDFSRFSTEILEIRWRRRWCSGKETSEAVRVVAVGTAIVI